MRFNRKLFNKVNGSLRWKVSLGVVLPLFLTLGIFTYIEYLGMHNSMLSNLSLVASQSGQLIEDNIRQQMLKQDFDSMQQMLDTISESQNFRDIYLLNPQGVIIFAPKNNQVGVHLDNHQPDCLPCHSHPADQRASSVIVTPPDGVRVFRTMNPIENGPACSKCHDPQQRLIGLLLLDIPTAPLEQSITSSLRKNLLGWVAMIVVTLLLVNFTLNRFVLHRLEEFVAAIRKTERGDVLPTLPDSSADELGNLALAYNDMAGQVEARQAENQALSENLRQENLRRGELLRGLISAQEDERKRVARELHDELGQSISGLSLRAEAVQKFLDTNPGLAREQLDQVKRMIVDTSDKMYDLILDLRPSVLDDLGLAPALRSYAARLFEESGIRVSIEDAQLNQRLPQEIEIVLYRVFQEAMNNVLRHSGATQVSIQLSRTAAGFEGRVADNGRGFDPGSIHIDQDSPRGLGILGMHERIEQCGGKLSIEAGPGKGAVVEIRIPLSGVGYG